jgi:hypothetical protein
MTLDAPNLDTRRFDDLVAEARQRIARWAPEWTDHNASDPGITLVELFAWLTETILYQLNRVPDLTYVKFLELIGLRQEPPSAALAELTFTVTQGAAGPVVVPAGAQVAGSGADGTPVVFETDSELTLVPYPLSDVWVDDGASFTSVLPAPGAPPAPYRPFGWVAAPGNALYLGFQPAPGQPAAGPATPGSPVAFPPELRLLVALPAVVARAQPVRSDQAVQPPAPPVRLAWEYLPEQGARWRELRQFADGTVALTREGYVQLAGPTAIAPTVWTDQPEPRYWLRVRLADGRYPGGGEPQLVAVTPNTVTARNLVTVAEELLGVAEGHPDELFTLLHAPVDASTLLVQVRPDPPAPVEDWRRVEDFLAAAPDEAVYTLDPDRGEVVFGNGVRGRIPPAGAEVVAVAYRYGGGTAGNLPAGALSELRSAVPGVDSVTNPRPSAGGSVRESLEDLKREAPALLRRQERAVTAEDYASLAREVGGVADAVALPLAHPDHPGVDVPGTVSVVVVADTGDDPPAPTAELLAGVGRHLEPRRMLTTELYLRPPTFHRVAVTASLTARPYAAPGAVVRTAVVALQAFLAPVRRDPDGSRHADFGQSFYPTELYRVLLADPNVVAVTRLELTVDGRPHEDISAPVQLPPEGLLSGGDHAITVATGELP